MRSKLPSVRGCKERHSMTHFILARSLSRAILVVAVCTLSFTWAPTALPQAPHGGPVGPRGPAAAPRGVPSIASPHVVGPPMVRAGVRGPHFIVRPRFGITPITAHFVPRPGFGFRGRRFAGLFVPLYRFPLGYGFHGVWWPTCAPALGEMWNWGYNCYPSTFYGYGYENFAALTPYEAPVYWYAGAPPEEIWLYRNDGTMQAVTDYWFVNGEVHYQTSEDDPSNPAAPHAFRYDDLDVQKTIFVNSRRGFRIVFRDAPWQQWMKDHPEQTPSDVPPAQGQQKP